MAVNFFNVIRRLMPSGRLFRLPFENTFYKFNKAISYEADRVKVFTDDTVNDGIPGNISENSLKDWESDLALLRNDSLTVAERNDRILSKLTAQGGQGKDYIQSILRARGFDVYLHEVVPAQDPNDIIDTINDVIAFGEIPQLFFENDVAFGEPTSVFGEDETEFGEQTTGRAYEIPVLPVSSLGIRITSEDDTRVTSEGDTRVSDFLSYDNSELWVFLFYIGGQTFPNRATIPIEREREFKSLVLSLKPANTWAIALVDYV